MLHPRWPEKGRGPKQEAEYGILTHDQDLVFPKGYICNAEAKANSTAEDAIRDAHNAQAARARAHNIACVRVDEEAGGAAGPVKAERNGALADDPAAGCDGIFYPARLTPRARGDVLALAAL